MSQHNLCSNISKALCKFAALRMPKKTKLVTDFQINLIYGLLEKFREQLGPCGVEWLEWKDK
jgi:hypothetical protein